ncbi:hypothetical protein [Haloferax mucosum]|uniref:hypothetical protein n=1 Tax=Haloferax mucosum TaxID=403181 RepID=UPI000677F3DF|nr:hypothetical protein [Haloferax mucosum]
MSPHSVTSTDDPLDTIPPEQPLFDATAPLRLAAGVSSAHPPSVGLYAAGWVSPRLPAVVGSAALCLATLSNGFTPFNRTLAHRAGLSAGFLVWGGLRLWVGGRGILPCFICVLGTIGLLVYGRRVLHDGLRTTA